MKTNAVLRMGGPVASTDPSLHDPLSIKSVATQAERWPTYLLVAFLTFGFGFLWIAIFGRVEGVELNTETLQRRDFSYYRIPIVDLQILPARVDSRTTSNVVANQLAAGQLLPKNESRAGRWDSAFVVQGGRPIRGNSDILSHYLDATDASGTPTWLAWTTSHPELAKILWAFVRNTVRLNDYTFLPQLFELARQTTADARARSLESDPDVAKRAGQADFRRQLQTAAATHWRFVADDLLASGQIETASQFQFAIDELDRSSGDSQ